jgi:hypothetical protein
MLCLLDKLCLHIFTAPRFLKLFQAAVLLSLKRSHRAHANIQIDEDAREIQSSARYTIDKEEIVHDRRCNSDCANESVTRTIKLFIECLVAAKCIYYRWCKLNKSTRQNMYVSSSCVHPTRAYNTESSLFVGPNIYSRESADQREKR